MGRDLTMRCACGALQAVLQNVDAKSGNHGVCHCHDCQAFAHFLARDKEILDGHGGTDLFQTSPAALRFTQGADRLACVRLTHKGLLRWYASCCNTPIGTTWPSTALPFLGLVLFGVEQKPGHDGLESSIGPIGMHAFRESARGDRSTIPADTIGMPRLMLKVAGLMLKWKLRGDGGRSPFFEATTGTPVAQPRILSETERATLQSAVINAAWTEA